MRIGFDAKRANANRTGLGNYSRYIISALAKFHPKYQIDLYLPKREKNSEYESLISLSKSISEHLPKSLFAKLFSAIWRIFYVAKKCEENGVQLFHGVSNEIPLGLKKRGIKSVVTIHDLIFLRRPQGYNFFDRFVYNLKFRYAAKKADKIVAISDCTKRDITQLYGTNPEKISVIYQGCDSRFLERFSAAEKERIRKRYNLPEKFFLSVGTIEERKNLLLCVKALEHLPADLHLVAVGRKTNYAKSVTEYAQQKGVANRLKIIDDCTYNDLPILYQLSSLFCYVSHYEGFGIPIIEALSSGIATIAASGSCLEEAGGDGATYVNPDDEKGLAKSILRLLKNNAMREQQIERGYKQIEKFTPEKIAADLDQLYKSVIRSSCQ